jgi:hypothetical protein
VEAKYREPEDPAVFWAYIAATRPVYAFEACVEYEEREAGAKGRPMQMRLARVEAMTTS